MFKKIFHFFDKLEDKIRARLSHYTIIYAIISGLAIVLFWRGVWETGDILAEQGGILSVIFYGPYSIVWTVIILLSTGLFVSFFVGDRIILSGIKNEKRIDQKNEEDIKKEEEEIKTMRTKITQISKDIEEIKNAVIHK
ncbi:MAG: hypothetical protein WC933_02860 [Candidatus Paceibacterota bacterium]|jgi:mannitol-specific phosphotransferase system IIBC component